MAFTALFRGYCRACDEPFAAGTRIRYNDAGETVHEVCPEPVEAVKPGEKPCPRCFAIHPGEC